MSTFPRGFATSGLVQRCRANGRLIPTLIPIWMQRFGLVRVD
jgi:hypothetical protein